MIGPKWAKHVKGAAQGAAATLPQWSCLKLAIQDVLYLEKHSLTKTMTYLCTEYKAASSNDRGEGPRHSHIEHITRFSFYFHGSVKMSNPFNF